MLARISAAKVSRISSGSVVHSFMIWRGAPAAMTVTAEAPSGTPRSAASDSQGDPSSSSAMQKLNLPGCPRVERSMPPGRTSNRLMRHRRTARPTTALARSLLPSALNVPSMPSRRRSSPLMTMNTAQPPVLAVAPCRENSSRSMAESAVTTTGKCRGRPPAITVLTATFSAVTARPRTGSTPRTCSGGMAAASRHAATASSVGGTTGSPSVQPAAVEELLEGEEVGGFVDAGRKLHGGWRGLRLRARAAARCRRPARGHTLPDRCRKQQAAAGTGESRGRGAGDALPGCGSQRARGRARRAG